MTQPIIHSLINADVGGFKPVVDYPGDNCCFIFQNRQFDFEGEREYYSDLNARRLQICHDGSSTVINLHDYGWGDMMSSYICGKNVWYDFCVDGLTNWCSGAERVNSGAGYVRNHALLYKNDMISFAVLGPYDPRDIGAVTLFEDPDCSGASGRYYWDPESSLSGTFYNTDDLVFGGMRNNNMNSLMVPKGYTAELFDGHGFHGATQIVEGDYLDAGEQMRCVNFEGEDNIVSSLIVKRQPQGAAVGQWQSITSTESQEMTYHTGLTYQNQSNNSWEEADRMNAALDLGVTFLSEFFAPLALIPTARNRVQRDVTSTYAYDYSVAMTTSCTVPDGSTGGAGLWQWIVSTEDGKTHSFSQHTVCRTGELFMVEPACPYYACANADCSECRPDWNVDYI